MTKFAFIFLITITMLSGYMVAPTTGGHILKEMYCANSADAASCKNHPIKNKKDVCKKECQECRTCLQVCCALLPATLQHKKYFAPSRITYGTLVQNKLSGFSLDVWKPPRV